MVHVCVVLTILLVNLLLYYEAAAADPESRRLILEYDKRVCENRPSCDLTNSVQKDRLDLRKRNCMCDFECKKYGDCCMDSIYFNAISAGDEAKKFFCHPFSKVYMITDCATDYQNDEVKSKCEQGTQRLEENDYNLIIPVTVPSKRLTYANIYCAQCNNEENYESWDFLAGCGESPDELGNYKPPSSTATTTKPRRPDMSPPSKSLSNQKFNSQPSVAAPARTPLNPSTGPVPTTFRPSSSATKRPTHSQKHTSVNTIPDTKPGSFVGGCKSEYSPCNSDRNTPRPQVHKQKPPESKLTPPVVTSLPQYTPQYIEGTFVDPHHSPIGSTLNIRIEIERFRRQSNQNMKIDYKKHRDEVDNLIDKAKYDPNVKKFVVQSDEGTTLACNFNATYPDSLKDVVRHCIPNLISKCGDGSDCPSYTSIAYDGPTENAYLNRECAMCNGINGGRLTGCLTLTRQAASKDLVKTNRKAQGDLSKLAESDSDAIGF